MDNLISIAIGIIVLIVIIGVLWKAGVLSVSLLPADATLRTVVYIILLVLLALFLWYLFGDYVRQIV